MSRPQVKADTELLASIPATGLVFFAIVAIQLGAVISKHLFPLLGADGTVAVRIILSALILTVTARSRITVLGRIFYTQWRLLILFGVCIAVMNLFFYLSIDLIPLGAAVALEFTGPLGVAALTSKRLSHFIWVAIAAVGIVLLSPLTGADLDPLGIVYALVAGLGWAVFIVLARKVGDRTSGNDGLAAGMTVAAIVMIPLAVPIVPDLVASPLILFAGFAVAILSTALPFTLEFAALKRLSARAYGVLVSMEPAVAAIVGVLLLGERMGLQSIAAIICIVVAAVGITLSEDAGSA